MANNAALQEAININELGQYGDMTPFYLKTTFSDITLILNEHEINAHKIVLAARCKYFESLLLEDPTLTRLTITDVSFQAFQILLKYIYTGCFSIDTNEELVFDVLKLAHEYAMKDLEAVMNEKVMSTVDVSNVFAILNKGNQYEISELVEKCHSFIDKNLSEILESDSLNNLTQQSMVKFLERDSLELPEIDVFKIVEKWCNINEDVDGLVIRCVHLSLLGSEEIFSTVWPSKLFDGETLMTVLEKNRNATSEFPKHRSRKPVIIEQLVTEKNIATPEFEAKVISGMNTSVLLMGNQDLTKSASHVIGDKNGITVDLGGLYYVNHIKMQLKNSDNLKLNENREYIFNNFSSYRYFIELSKDRKKWDKIIDYTQYDCRSFQNLFFDRQITQYVRVVGTYCSTGNKLEIVNLEIYCKSEIPSILDQIIRPIQNVALRRMGALVITGQQPDGLICDDVSVFYAHHLIDKGHIMVQLAQPYVISTMRLMLGFANSSYFVETSVNKADWEMAVDRRNQYCHSWQDFHFRERPVVYIRIIGTRCVSLDAFYCKRFECFSKNLT